MKQKAFRKFSGLGFEIGEEAESFISNKAANKRASNINLQMIAKLRSEGKEIRGLLMKNNLCTFVQQFPLWGFYEKGEINNDLFSAGQKYARSYFMASKDNMAKQTYDGSFSASSSPTSKEPANNQIEAARLLTAIRKDLDHHSIALKPFKRLKNIKQIHKNFKQSSLVNKNYVLLLDLFLGEEKGLRAIEVLLKVRQDGRVKERIIEALEIVSRFLKNGGDK